MKLSFVWWFLVLAATLNYGVHRWETASYTYDETQQIAAAISLLSGNGLVRVYPEVEDLSRVVHKPLYEWPQGYSVIFAGVYALTKKVGRTLLCLEGVSAFFFFLGYALLIEALAIGLGLVQRYLLGGILFFVFSPLGLGQSSDVLCAGLYFGALGFCLACHPSEWIVGLVTGLCLGISASVRYAYLPLLPVFPLGFILLRRGKAAAIHLAVVVVMVALGFIEQKYRTTEMLGLFRVHHEHQVQAGLFLNQLRWTAPFIAFFLWTTRLFGGLAAMGVKVSESHMAAYNWMLTFAVLAWAGVGLKKLSRVGWTFPLIVGGLTSLFTVATLTYLSVRHKQAYLATWVHLSEPRYFLPMIPFIGILCALPLWNIIGERKIAANLSLGLLLVMAVGSMAGQVREHWLAYSRPGFYHSWWDIDRETHGDLLWGFFRALATTKDRLPLYVDANPDRKMIAFLAGIPAIHPDHFLTSLGKRQGGLDVLVHPSCDESILNRLRHEATSFSSIPVGEKVELIRFSLPQSSGERVNSV